MGEACSRCGKSLSLLGGLMGDTCPECQEALADERESVKRKRAVTRAKRELEAGKRSYEAALRGEASMDDARRLESDGYLVILGRLIRCPVCGNEKFGQRSVLMNTRGATFLEIEWANRGADARICIGCSYVMMFAR